MTRKWVENETINEEIMDCPKMLHIEHAYSPLGVHFRGRESGIKNRWIMRQKNEDNGLPKNASF